MATPISLFDYHLPSELIAQEPMRPRDHSRLLVMDRASGAIRHKVFYEIADELRAGDLLVMNNSKVFKARLKGKCKMKNGKCKILEVFLLRFDGVNWSALLKPGRKASIGDWIDLGGLIASVLEKHEGGVVTLAINATFDDVLAFTDTHGEIPVPPYVDHAPSELSDYQTVYAKNVGSVAAPTAGFHFTEELIEILKTKGIQFEFVTLHVGLGTFRPVKTDTLEEHEMHAEFVSIDADTAARIHRAKQEGRRVIAVGTTTVRALEGSTLSSYCATALPATGFVGDVNIFITPGFDFKIIDGLITNFHLPKSTLLVLISAFAGREYVLHAYKEAIRLGYRFYSFGDAMFVTG